MTDEFPLNSRFPLTAQELLVAFFSDILNPTTTIRGYSDLLLNERVGELSDKQREFATKINQSAIQLLNLRDRYMKAVDSLRKSDSDVDTGDVH